MSKWKCGICNTGFDNYQAQGFDGVIYCPLCYFKELYKREKQENQQLKKERKDIVEYIKHYINVRKDRYPYIDMREFDLDKLLRMLGERDD